MVIVDNVEQLENAPPVILTNPSDKNTDDNEVQLVNAELSIIVTPLGMVIDRNELHELNTSAKAVTSSGMVIDNSE